MEKTIVIKHCDNCPFFDNEYYTFNEECSKEHKRVPEGTDNNHPIPEWCPLGELTVVEER